MDRRADSLLMLRRVISRCGVALAGAGAAYLAVVGWDRLFALDPYSKLSADGAVPLLAGGCALMLVAKFREKPF